MLKFSTELIALLKPSSGKKEILKSIDYLRSEQRHEAGIAV